MHYSDGSLGMRESLSQSAVVRARATLGHIGRKAEADV